MGYVALARAGVTGGADRRRRSLARPGPRIGPAFVPVKRLELDVSRAPASDVVAKPARQTSSDTFAPFGKLISIAPRPAPRRADVDAEALRRVLLALGVV